MTTDVQRPSMPSREPVSRRRKVVLGSFLLYLAAVGLTALNGGAQDAGAAAVLGLFAWLTVAHMVLFND